MTNETDTRKECKKEKWSRLLYIVLFAVILYVVLMLLWLTVFVQVVFSFISGTSNKEVRTFGGHLARYINQIILFLTFNENRRPYPFNPLFEETDDDLDDFETDEEETETDYVSVETLQETTRQDSDDGADKPSR